MCARRYQDPYSGKMKSSSYFYKKRARRKLERMLKNGADKWYPWPVSWSDYVRNPNNWRNNGPAPGAYPVRNYRPKRSRYLKQRGHRLNRHNKEVTSTTYNKHFDYWWELD